MNTNVSTWIRVGIISIVAWGAGAHAGENHLPPASASDKALTGIVNPHDSTCYDWKDNIIPCEYKRPYAELLPDATVSDSRFIDNNDGTVTDRLTKLVWLKHTNCFGMVDWKQAARMANGLKHGDCGPHPDLVLSDRSSAGDWRVPTMGELCTLIDFRRREPALPDGHMFVNIPSGYHWSATTLSHHAELVWIVYIESGTTCYDDIAHRAGHLWPVRGPLE